MSSNFDPNPPSPLPTRIVRFEGDHADSASEDVDRISNLVPSAEASPILDERKRTAQLIVVVEGGHDVQFLKRIASILHADDPQLPDLRARELSGEIIFVPCGGSNFCHWTHRLAGLDLPEFHIYDREIPPLTGERQQAADSVNRRPDCHAVLTGKRATENYLSPDCLREARGIDLDFGDDDDVPQLVARYLLERSGGPDWSELPARGRRRLRDRTKKWLNTEAVSRMTPGRLTERDPDNDIRLWLTTIAWLGGFRD